MFGKNLSKKAQVGETVTWVVATIAVLVILGISIFVVSFNLRDKAFDVDKKADLIVAKSLSAYLLVPDQQGGIVFDQLKNDNFNEFNKPLAKELFQSVLSEGYGDVIMLIDDDGSIIMNDDFQTSIMNSFDNLGKEYSNYVIESVELDEDKEIKLLLLELE